MNLLLLGSGGREHTLAWKIAQSKRVNKLFIAPGNAGTLTLGKNIDLDIEDFEAIKKVVLSNNISMIVVGPEAPLVKGIYDFFTKDKETKHVHVIGPSKLGAQLEGSKEFAKAFMQRNEIPTAKYKTITANNIEEGIDFLKSLEAPYVLKADGLCAGKGVLILPTLEEAISSLKEMLAGQFGEASNTVVIEEFLSGIECSVFVLTDGNQYKVLPIAKDYKRIGEGDTGLNTGGMGSVSPVPFVTEQFYEKIIKQVLESTIKEKKKEGIIYKGFIFIGLIKVKDEPMVIEYNVRMGDPETESVVPRIQSDLVELFEGVVNGNLNDIEMILDKRTVTSVILVSGGYPESYEKGFPIKGLETEADSNTLIFHAGTKLREESVVTNGGRVLAVSAFGDNMAEALNQCYKTIDKVEYSGKYYRKDIGFDL